MPWVIAFLIFAFIEIALLPLSVLGAMWYFAGLYRVRKKQKLSLTAYKIIFQRFLLHSLGRRSDPACLRLMPCLPGCSSLQIALFAGPSLLASRLSGLRPPSLEYPVARPSSYGTFIGHRTEFFDAALRSSLDSVEQIVILGAGWDTRAYSLLRDFRGSIYEVDRAPMQDAKRRALERAGLPTDYVNYVPVDFRRESWLERVIEQGFSLEKRTFFLWEGVVYYLEPVFVHQTLEDISRLCRAESLVAFDYPSATLLESDERWVNYALDTLRSLGEAWHFGIATEPYPEGHLQTFLQTFGLKISRFEPFGPEEKCFGGVVLAILPNPSSAEADH